ncbi:helix-turn-helix transcriptional regulator [Collinsella sp. HCP28S3_E5]|uniref:helix-turn-helix transcriptional regulator n=1 Tax=unclassified Collinsella TaxID=2637548 RepID=UPI003F888170
METVDLSSFMEKTKSAETIAYEHALELSYLAVDEMRRQGITKKELAQRMGVSAQRLANMLNTQTNMTLKTLAQFELALGIQIDFNSALAFTSELPYRTESRMEGVDSWRGEKVQRSDDSMQGKSSAEHLTMIKGGLAA